MDCGALRPSGKIINQQYFFYILKIYRVLRRRRCHMEKISKVHLLWVFIVVFWYPVIYHINNNICATINLLSKYDPEMYFKKFTPKSQFLQS